MGVAILVDGRLDLRSRPGEAGFVTIDRGLYVTSAPEWAHEVGQRPTTKTRPPKRTAEGCVGGKEEQAVEAATAYEDTVREIPDGTATERVERGAIPST